MSEPHRPTTERWRDRIELAVPGAVIGARTGVIAGLLTAAVGLGLPLALAAAAGLGLPMAAFGAGYSLLLATGTIRPGVFAPAALYWLVAFPLARTVHEVSVHLAVAGRPGLPDSAPAFLAYQALVSIGFAIGYVWLHERVTLHWLLRIRGHNPDAAHLLTRYLHHAETRRHPEERQKEGSTGQARGKPTPAGQRPA